MVHHNCYIKQLGLPYFSMEGYRVEWHNSTFDVSDMTGIYITYSNLAECDYNMDTVIGNNLY